MPSLALLLCCITRCQPTSMWCLVDHPVACGNVLQAGHAAGWSATSERTIMTHYWQISGRILSDVVTEERWYRHCWLHADDCNLHSICTGNGGKTSLLMFMSVYRNLMCLMECRRLLHTREAGWSIRLVYHRQCQCGWYLLPQCLPFWYSFCCSWKLRSQGELPCVYVRSYLYIAAGKLPCVYVRSYLYIAANL